MFSAPLHFVFQMVLGQSDFVIEDMIQMSLPDYPKMTTTHTFYENHMNFLVQRPRELQPEYSIAFVLDKATWAAFFVSWLIVIFIFATISKMNVSTHFNTTVIYRDTFPLKSQLKTKLSVFVTRVNLS